MLDVGLVTAAAWTDHNNDQKKDLILVGEWMPITTFTQIEDGRFEKQILSGLENSEGWYFDIQVEDMDGDGDDDFIVGNLGLNYTYTASTESPLEIFAGDFDLNGSNDIVICYSVDNSLYPWVGRDRAIKQIPTIEKEYSNFKTYSKATVEEIYGASLDKALNFKAKTFASMYVENLEDNKFQFKPLPSLAQASAINRILIKDFDLDGIKDLLIAGNLYQTEIEIPRHDAGTGLLLKGEGNGEFKEISTTESGFYTPNDVKEMQFVDVNGKEIILVGNNNSPIQIIEYIPPDTDF